jgi:hypothetical protein
MIECSTTRTYPWPDSCLGIFSSRKRPLPICAAMSTSDRLSDTPDVVKLCRFLESLSSLVIHAFQLLRFPLCRHLVLLRGPLRRRAPRAPIHPCDSLREVSPKIPRTGKSFFISVTGTREVFGSVELFELCLLMCPSPPCLPITA